MALKKYNPITPCTRGMVLVDKGALWKKGPEKTLVRGIKKNGGRNNLGRITALRKGGGVKKVYRKVDFKRRKDNMKAVVERIEYDPNRTSFIALIKYEDNTLSYIIAPQKLAKGDIVESGELVDVKDGNTLPLKNIPVGTVLHNVEMKPGKGGQLARSAGTSVQLAGRDGIHALLKLSSGELRMVHSDCRATVGVVSNHDQQNIKLGKAGKSRLLGIRPIVRGVAKNPVDHPHGGGEGKTSGGRHPVNRKGLSAKGKRTRNNARTDKYIIRRRKK